MKRLAVENDFISDFVDLLDEDDFPDSDWSDEQESSQENDFPTDKKKRGYPAS